MPERYRLHYDREVVRVLYALGVPGAAVREAIRGLATNPRPDTARTVAERMGLYELFIDGYWIAYSVDDEAYIIKVLSIDEPAE